MHSKVIFPILAVTLSFIFVSCGPRVIAQGMLLWSPAEDQIPNAAVVGIVGESSLRGSYDVRYRREGQDDLYLEVDTWRIQLAENRNELEALISSYQPYAEYTGRAEIQALPVRTAMATDASTSIIYRMRQDEKGKILFRTPEEVAVGGLVDYWFEILTADGTRGYVFGYRLDVLDARGESIESTGDSRDELLQGVLESMWRPDYFAWMIEDNVYDLSRFRADYRFEHIPQEQRFILTTENFSREFVYSDIYQARYREYVAEGTSLQLTAYDEDSISIQFTADGTTFQESLERVEADVEQIISDENERRKNLLSSFLERGTRFTSSSYGSISIDKNAGLQWSGISGLNATMVPPWFNGRGQLRFNLYLISQLQNLYEGALSITQPGVGIDKSLNFFYRFANGGLQLEFIPPQNISHNIVQKPALSPFVMFFTING